MRMKTVWSSGSTMALLVLAFEHTAAAQPPAGADPGPQPAVPTPAAPTTGNAGGHVGIAVPLVTVTKDDTTSIGDQFTLLHPIGVGVKVAHNLAVDFEVVVANPIDPVGDTGLVVDPGIVYNWGGVATGLRAAWKIGQTANFGLIPLVNVGLVDFDGATWFAEAAFPTFYSDHALEFNVVLHTGVGF